MAPAAPPSRPEAHASPTAAVAPTAGGARRPWRLRDGLVLGAALVAGWVLHDLAVFLARVGPQAVRELLPASAVVVAVGALAGLASVRPRLLLALDAVLLAVLVFRLRPGPAELATAAYWLPRALLLLLVALNAARLLCAQKLLGARGARRAGLCLGMVAGVLLLRQMRGALPAESAAILCAALLALLLGAWRRAPARRLATALAALACLALVVRQAQARGALLRADLAPPAAPAAGGPNLLFIVLDTVAAGHLAPYGYSRGTTPHLDRFARAEATLYAAARSTSSWTLPSHASLFTGLLPGEHGATHLRTPPGAERRSVWPARPLREDVLTLAERLRERGYQTAAIIANGIALRHQFRLDQGFERYDDRRGGWLQKHLALAQLAGFALRTGHYPYRDGRTITGLALDWLDERRAGQPFLLFLNYMDAHWPYVPPAPFEGAFEALRPRDALAPERELHALLYDRQLLGLDAQLGRLLDALRARGLWDETAIVVTSDHGEAFGEHGFWRHDFALYEELLRVPLYVKPAGGRRAARDETPLTGAEVHGLILELLGLPAERQVRELPVVAEWYQQDLEAVGDWEQLFSAVDLQRDLIAWIEDGTKWIVSSRGDVEAYDLARDPGERAPLTLTADQAEQARRRAQAWWATHIPPTVELESLDPEARAQLRALGYFGGGED